MNDASGEAVGDHVQALEPDNHHIHPIHGGDDQAHLDPSRWWFASAAFPMIAGTLGPVASAFSICALVRPWRQSYQPESNPDYATYIADPVWLTAINAVQLAMAIIANLALLLNMTRRLRFSIAQPITIVGWYISSITLVVLTATASGPLLLQPTDQHIWSQAFYYGIYSAILYLIVGSLMLVTFMGAHLGRYEKDFKLTPSQRTLMLQTIMFLMYLLVGALVFSNIEGWDYLDAVYWSAVTLFTVGFGDFYATTTLGRALLMPYALVGIISLGLVIGSIRSLVLDRGRRRFDARLVEKKRRTMIRRMTLKGNDEILKPVGGRHADPMQHLSESSRPSTGLTELERREEEFKLMRKIQEDAARRRRWYSLAISGSTWMVLWLVGAKIFQECEIPYQGWTYFDAFYFAFCSLTTIGYGDTTPISNSGKSFWVFWALLALPTMTVLISNAGDTIVKGIRDATDQVAMVTILPGDRGFRKDLKLFFKMISCGTLFSEEIEEAPLGFLGDAQRQDYSDTDNDVERSLEKDQADLEKEGATTAAGRAKRERDAKDEEKHRGRVDDNTASEASTKRLIKFGDESKLGTENKPPSQQAIKVHQGGVSSGSPGSPSSPNNPIQLKMTRTPSIPRNVLPDIPSNKAEYHVTLIEEIGRVMEHLKAHPPRKYTFWEWAWYLRLIGEDENDADRHRKPLTHLHGGSRKEKRLLLALPHFRHRGSKNNDGEDDRHPVDGGGSGNGKAKASPDIKSWSWVDSRSPLMGSQEEAEWILEKLTRRLTEELKGVSRVERRKSHDHSHR
ncbi:hypothetical protein B0T26DRAFT_405084 [Lasiosphaeria miniovina]|uniref:Potassium channel domain-containing protein n=1 Tax=Lasiosphaeria miniovina TaxID=1954250 RepID=A0AA40A591_9PEZI|nr:uncharacterized protein B0T26DRAFT_405084 [Lasiosphaeria miniovina]KAK0709425.1 hypothetical protein B0T26DRAFT_405084 [Lasiosphaeria miniovina]